MIVDEPTPQERLYAIVRQGLCIGCGLCQSIAGKEKISVARSTSGYELPVVIGDIDHETVDKIYDVCPGTRIDGLPPRLLATDTRVDNVWGPWRRIVRAWASDPEVRFEGSTGGVLTALGMYLLESGRVDFVLHARASRTHPTFGERHLSFEASDVVAGAGSRYGPTAVLVDIDEILERNQPFAFIAKPCDIDALRNYARHDDRVDRLVRYWLTLVCGGFAPPAFTDAFIESNGISPRDVVAFRYRGRGCPGPTRVETEDRVVEKHYLDFWGDDASQWTLPHRCKICPDGIGEGADIAAADTWPGGSPRREETADDPGTNAVIARTEAGQTLLEEAVEAGVLTIEYDVAPDEMNFYQIHQMRKKYAVWARFQGLAAMDRIVPQTNGLRIAELAREMPDEFNAHQTEGTKDRVKRGKASIEHP